MNWRSISFFRWPEMLPLPPLRQPVVVMVPTSTSRPVARQELRAVLRQMLACWSNIPPAALPLRETPRGPAWEGLLAGHPLDVSFSYAGDIGCIGLIRAGQIGVDVMAVVAVPEMAVVAKTYLDPDECRKIQAVENPARAFAEAWTSLEAGLKCRKSELIEYAALPESATPDGIMLTVLVDGERVVAVAVGAA